MITIGLDSSPKSLNEMGKFHLSPRSQSSASSTVVFPESPAPIMHISFLSAGIDQFSSLIPRKLEILRLRIIKSISFDRFSSYRLIPVARRMLEWAASLRHCNVPVHAIEQKKSVH